MEGKLCLSRRDGVEICPGGLLVEPSRALPPPLRVSAPRALPALQLAGESLPEAAARREVPGLLPGLAGVQILLQHLHQDVEVLQAFGGLPGALLALKRQQKGGQGGGGGGGGRGREADMKCPVLSLGATTGILPREPGTRGSGCSAYLSRLFLCIRVSSPLLCWRKKKTKGEEKVQS